MKTLILDTALPLSNGSARQRVAEHLRRAIETQGDVAHVTIDIWRTEWSSRMQMSRRDRFVGLPRSECGRQGFLAQPGAGSSPAVTPSDDPVIDPDAASLLTVRRRAVGELRHIAPDRILIADPLLAPLVSWFEPIVPEIDIGCDGAGDWHLRVSEQISDAGFSAWHKALGERILELGRGVDQTRLPLAPMRFKFDDLYLAKAANIFVPATGFAWLDHQIISHLVSVRCWFEGRGVEPPEISLMGFPPELAARIPGALYYRDWQHLVGLVGAARAMIAPWLPPAMTVLADAALALGTPVVTNAMDAALSGLAGREGVVAVEHGKLAQAIMLVMDPELVDAHVHARISDRARTGVPEPEPSQDRRPRRVGALAAPPEVLFNALSDLLLVRLKLRTASQVEEVRIIASDGRELNRLMPTEAQKKGAIVALEGGAVIGEDELGAGVSLELHDLEGRIEEAFVSAEDFVRLEAELAYLERDDKFLNGAFWTVRGAGTSAWEVGSSAYPSHVRAREPIEMPEVDGVAMRFRVPLELGHRQDITLFRRDGGPNAVFEEVIQRTYHAGRVDSNPLQGEVRDVLALRDRHLGGRAWIVGNGPSVRHEDLAAISEGDIVFCFNRFYLSYPDHPLREDYVVSADTLMVEDFGQEMIDISTGLPLFCIHPSVTKDLRGKFVRMTPSDNHLPVFSGNAARSVAVGGSSVFVALQMAHYMGIRDVALYGIDYSFNMHLVRDPRFPFPVSFQDGNHFIKSYRGTRPWCPPTWRDISAGFLNARVAFEITGGRIVNATRGGRLETFPRVDFDDFVRGGFQSESPDKTTSA